MHERDVPGDTSAHCHPPLSEGAAFVLPDDTLYLDTAAHGPRLRAVHAAARAALEAGATPWRLDAAAWQASIECVRGLAARLFCGDDDGVALVPSAAYGLSIAARNLPLSRGDAVLVLDGQFPSNLLPWQQRCAEVGARLVVARRAPDRDWTAALLAALDDDPAIRVLTLPQVYWHDGARLDLDRIAAQAQARDAALVLDLSQSLGALPAELARWRPQFVVSVGHKWLLGAPGLAYLWAAPHWREHGVSIEQHWSAREPAEDWRFPPEHAAPYRRGARRFDAGGVTDPLRLAMAQAALEQIHAWGVARISACLGDRTAAFDAGLRARAGAGWLMADHAPHMLGLRPGAALLPAVAAALSDAGAVFTNRHGVLRLAPHLQVQADAMFRLGEAVGEVLGRG